MFSFCTAHYAPHKIVLHFREAEVTGLSSVNLETFTGGKRVNRKFILALILIGFILMLPTLWLNLPGF